MVTANYKDTKKSVMIKDIFYFLSRRINTQHIFCFLAFLTLGVIDGLTASNMMGKIGTGAEHNVFISSVYASQGIIMVIATKMSLAVLLIIGALMVYRESRGKSYWMTNGFLVSLTIGGLIASIQNLHAAAGLPYMSPEKFYFLFLLMAFVLVEIGDFIDNHTFVVSDKLYPLR